MLAADALMLHGLTLSLAIIDELHAHFDDSVYLAMRTAAMKTAQLPPRRHLDRRPSADSPLDG